MPPKEKANEMYNQFLNAMPHPSTTNAEIYVISKQCALIAVDEILSDYKNYLMHENTEYKGLIYWQEVKQEIENL